MLKNTNTALYVLALLFALMPNSFAQSQQQTPANQTPKTEQRTEQDKRGTKEQPLTVNIIPTAEQQTEAEKQARDAQLKSIHDEKLIDYTGDLVLVGLVQFAVFLLQLIAFVVQAIYIRASAEEMRKTTEAAENVAKDQIAHSHKIERAYMSGGGAINQVFHSFSAHGTPIYVPGKDFVFCVNNYGKTVGELSEIGYGFCDAADIPPVPSYDVRYFHDWIMPGDRGRPLFQIPLPPKNTAVFGRFYYRDIFGGRHSCGFINRVGPSESVPISAPAAYTDERDES